MSTINIATGSSYSLDVDFADSLGAAVIPTSATYEVIDLTSGTTVRAETEISGLTASIEILLTADDTLIVDSDNETETREVRVNYVFGDGETGSLTYEYTIVAIDTTTATASGITVWWNKTTQLKLYTEPAEEPVILNATVRKHLRVSTTDDDELIRWYIKTARLHCEAYHGRKYITQTWDMYIDQFPSESFIKIPYAPLQSVTHVKYKDTSGVLQTWAASNYIVDANASSGKISLAYGISWPSTYQEIQAVQIRFICGYGLAVSVPQNVTQAILLKTADLYENRGDSEGEFVTNTKERAVESLLSSDRIIPI